MNSCWKNSVIPQLTSCVNKKGLWSLQNSFVPIADPDPPLDLSCVINPRQAEGRQAAGQTHPHLAAAWAPAPQHLKTLSLQGRALPSHSWGAGTCGVF